MKLTGLQSLWRQMSHQVIIGLIGLFMIFFVWTTAFLQIERDYRSTVADVYRENSNMAKAFEEHVRRTLISVDNQLKQIGREYERRGRISPTLRDLLHAESFDPAILQIRLVDSNGYDVVTMLPGDGSSNVRDREYFRVHRESGNVGLFIDKPNIAKLSGKWVMHVSRRMNNPDGSFKGVVTAAVQADYFGQFYKQMDLGDRKLISIVGLDGIVKVRMENDVIQSGVDVSRGEVFQRVKNQPTGSLLAVAAPDGLLRFTSYRVMLDYPLFILVGVQQDQALADHYLRRTVNIVRAVLASVFIIFVGYIIARHRKREMLAQKQMARIEKMTALGSLAAGVIHEVSQPLQAIKVTADAMVYRYDQGKTDSPEQVAENCRRISSYVSRSSTIIKRLRDYINRSQSVRDEVVDLNVVEQRAVEILLPRLKSHNISLQEDLTSESPIVWGNSVRLEEVIVNLVVNAMQALETADNADKTITISTACFGGKILLEIHNNGPAIPVGIIEKVFDPFFSTKKAGENMGLGLSIVQTIVNTHEGKISVANQDNGVSFKMEFPRHSG